MINNFRVLSYGISLVLTLVCLTFIPFFFSDPFQSGINPLTVTQFISGLGWILLVLVPPIILAIGRWNGFTKTSFLIAALLWPVTLIAIRIILGIQLGNPYLGYLITYPIFIFTDVLVPAIYALLWVRMNKKNSLGSERRSAKVIYS